MLQRAIVRSRSPSGALRTIGAARSGRRPGARLPLGLRRARFDAGGRTEEESVDCDPSGFAKEMRHDTLRFLDVTSSPSLGEGAKTIKESDARALAVGDALSIAAAAIRPIKVEANRAARPAVHRPASAASGAPATASLPVQLGIAVKRNPATTAPPYPKIISCACQSIGEKAVETTISPTKNGGQMAMLTSAQMPATSKNGRKPRPRPERWSQPERRADIARAEGQSC